MNHKFVVFWMRVEDVWTGEITSCAVAVMKEESSAGRGPPNDGISMGIPGQGGYWPQYPPY
jgi:hypothetical protein